MKKFLRSLSPRVGIALLLLCVVCYVVSLWGFWRSDVPLTDRGLRFVIFFGLAKTFQYSGLTILGVDGLKRIRAYFSSKKAN